MSIECVVGSVKRLRAVTRNRVQLEFAEVAGVYELFIDQSWVVHPGDRVAVAGRRDETGKVCCYSYRNVDRAVSGWMNYRVHAQPVLFLGVGLLLFLGTVTSGRVSSELAWALGGLLFALKGGFAWVEGMRDNHAIRQARRLVQQAAG